MPNLIEVQKASYDQFLHGRRSPTAAGSTKACRRCSSRCSRSRISPRPRMLEFVRYEFEPPKYDVEECQQRGMTYAAPLKVTLRLIVFDIDEETGAKSVKDIKEQDVYMGDIPLMTDERHLHRQRHRARHRLPDAPLARRVLRPRQGQDPFVGQASVRRARHSLSRLLARLRVRRQGHRLCAHRPPPQAAGDVAAVRARPRRRRDPQLLLQARSPSSAPRTAGACRSTPTACAATSAINDLVDAETGKVVLEAGKKITVRQAAQARRKRASRRCACRDEELVGHYLAEDMVNAEDRRDLCRSRRRDHREAAQDAERGRASRKCRCSTSTTSMSAPISATRCMSTRTRRAKTR